MTNVINGYQIKLLSNSVMGEALQKIEKAAKAHDDSVELRFHKPYINIPLMGDEATTYSM